MQSAIGLVFSLLLLGACGSGTLPNRNPQYPILCSSLDDLKAAATTDATVATILPQRVYDEIAANGGRTGPQMRVGSETRSLTIQFHDMDAADGDRAIATIQGTVSNEVM